MGKKLIKSFGELELSTAINHKYIYIYIYVKEKIRQIHVHLFHFYVLCIAPYKTGQQTFKTINQISNRYGALLFTKNALRKGEK